MRNELKLNAFEMLRRQGTLKSVHVEVEPSQLELVDPRLVPASSIAVDLECESLSDGVVVRGTVAMEFRGECRRCLQPLHARIEVEVGELYQTVITDPDAFPIENDVIDLVPMVRETVLLELPDAPLCRAECAGLCPTCGRDLNQGQCSCRPETRDPRWSALDALREQLPE